MPIYEYICKNCKHKFELMRPFSKSNEGADCPRCKKKAERVISTCYSKTADLNGAVQQLGGGSSCSSCGSSNCSTCGS
jgi:putative FmdB family regulatory protein